MGTKLKIVVTVPDGYMFGERDLDARLMRNDLPVPVWLAAPLAAKVTERRKQDWRPEVGDKVQVRLDRLDDTESNWTPRSEQLWCRTVIFVGRGKVVTVDDDQEIMDLQPGEWLFRRSRQPASVTDPDVFDV